MSDLRPRRAVRLAADEPAGMLVWPVGGRQHLVLRIEGEADLATADQLREQLQHAVAGHPDSITVDLRELSFCDATGLDALYAGLAAARASGVLMMLTGVSPLLRWLMRLLPEGRHRTLVPTQRRADDSL